MTVEEGFDDLARLRDPIEVVIIYINDYYNN